MPFKRLKRVQRETALAKQTDTPQPTYTPVSLPHNRFASNFLTDRQLRKFEFLHQ
jgi:hypothetical protein